ncbi:MAG: enoyl-CoA hydratase-related protein [Pseudomonadota bacterium]
MDAVLTEMIGPHVLLVTLNRPHKRNAIDVAAARALAASVRRVEQDDDIRVAILTGAGACFCAGADLGDIAAGHGDQLSVDGNGLGGFVHAPRTKPWIAAVRGMALGGGLELALACELLVSSDDAVMVLPEVRRGLLAAAGGVYRAPLALPRALALEMLLTGAPMAASRAHAHGMVNYMVPDGDVLSCAIALAETVAANAPLAVRASLAIARAASNAGETGLRAQMEAAIAQLGASDDAREGVAAFVDKRAPHWSGR